MVSQLKLKMQPRMDKNSSVSEILTQPKLVGLYYLNTTYVKTCLSTTQFIVNTLSLKYSCEFFQTFVLSQMKIVKT